MTIREFNTLCNEICNKIGDRFMSLTLWEFFFVLCFVGIFIFYWNMGVREEN
jgi:hypothetical protein